MPKVIQYAFEVIVFSSAVALCYVQPYPFSEMYPRELSLIMCGIEANSALASLTLLVVHLRRTFHKPIKRNEWGDIE